VSRLQLFRARTHFISYRLEVALLEEEHQGQTVPSQAVITTYRLPWHFKVGRKPSAPLPEPMMPMILPSVWSSALSEGEDQMISLPRSPNARALAARSVGTKGVAGPLLRKRALYEAYLDYENLLESTWRRRVRPRLEHRNSTPSTEGPGHPRPFTTATGPRVTQGNTTDGVPSSSGISNAPTASMTPWVSPPDSPLPQVQRQQSSARPGESITTVLRGANPRSGPVSGGIEIWLGVDDLPTTFTLYARFGTQVAATVSPNISSILPYLISVLGA
jgi:hypothetical protein